MLKLWSSTAVTLNWWQRFFCFIRPSSSPSSQTSTVKRITKTERRRSWRTNKRRTLSRVSFFFLFFLFKFLLRYAATRPSLSHDRVHERKSRIRFKWARSIYENFITSSCWNSLSEGAELWQRYSSYTSGFVSSVVWRIETIVRLEWSLQIPSVWKRISLLSSAGHLRFREQLGPGLPKHSLFEKISTYFSRRIRVTLSFKLRSKNLR